MRLTKSIDSIIRDVLDRSSEKLQEHFEGHVISYAGPIHPALLQEFRTAIERTRLSDPAVNRLVVFLNTPGGSAAAAEKMVDIMRHHYQEVEFVVPDMAMSAGTILVMSGDKIWMDYSSSLGPVDPQVEVRQPSGQNAFVPALGYLDKVAEWIEKSKNGQLTQAEMAMLLQLDLGNLRAYEQAKELAISLLKKWLVEYKFKDWVTHRTNIPGSPVTEDQKNARAEEIAEMLCSNRTWFSHGRFIGIETLRSVVMLEIEDYSADPILEDIRQYSDTLVENMSRLESPYAIHSIEWSTLG